METLDDQTIEAQIDPSVLMTLRLLRKYNHDGGTNYGLLNFVGALVLFAAAAYLLVDASANATAGFIGGTLVTATLAWTAIWLALAAGALGGVAAYAHHQFTHPLKCGGPGQYECPEQQP